MVAGPGAGKSAASLLLAGHMKARGMKVEYVREIPKDMVWDNRGGPPDVSLFTEQDYVLALQNNLFRRMLSHDIDYVVTDTSMLLGLIYKADWYPKSFDQFLLDVHASYNNITFYVGRGDIPYVQDGRNENQQEARTKDSESLMVLYQYNIPFHTVVQKNGVYDHASLEMLSVIEGLRK